MLKLSCAEIGLFLMGGFDVYAKKVLGTAFSLVSYAIWRIRCRCICDNIIPCINSTIRNLTKWRMLVLASCRKNRVNALLSHQFIVCIFSLYIGLFIRHLIL